MWWNALNGQNERQFIHRKCYKSDAKACKVDRFKLSAYRFCIQHMKQRIACCSWTTIMILVEEFERLGYQWTVCLSCRLANYAAWVLFRRFSRQHGHLCGKKSMQLAQNCQLALLP